MPGKESVTDAKKTSVKRTATKKTGARKTAAKSLKSMTNPATSEATGITQNDTRYQMIATAAYYRAEKRGFGGDAVQDWLEAEVEIDSKGHNH